MGGVVGGWAAVQRTKRSWLVGSSIWGDAAVRRAVLLGKRWPCNGRDTVEVVGEKRWCDGPRGGCGLQHFGTMRWCNEQCCRGRGSGATDNGGGCSGVFVFFLHMGMGEIHWREEGYPIINRIKDRDFFM